MKKLMVTIAAAAMSFGLFASDWATGTSFETLTDTAPLPLLTGYSDELSGDPAGYWDAVVTDTVQIVAYEAGEAKEGDARPQVFQSGAGVANYLKVKTAFNEPLNRYIQGDKSAKAVPETGLYYDGLVRMTAFDDDSASENLPQDTKIALWLQEGANEGDPTTLKLSAGEIGAEGVLSRKIYDLGEVLAADEWARITIKVIGNISAETGTYIPGFIVFKDKEALTFEGVNFGNLKLTANAEEFKKANMLFPAYVADVSLEANSSLTSIGFAGQGGVDDISFRDEAPGDIDAAKDFTFFTLAWNENVATIDGVPVEGAGSRYELIADDKTYTYAYTAKDGYMDGSFSVPENEPEAGVTYTIAPTALAATVTIGGETTSCGTLDKALGLIEEAKVDCTLKLGQDITKMTQVKNTAGKIVTIDLAGKKVSAIIGAMCPVVVIDTVGGAVVSAKINGTDVTIEAGTYDIDLPSAAKLCGGRFSQEKYATAPTSSKAGWEFTEGTGEDEGYWVLTEKSYAEINGKGYPTLGAAIDALEGGETITLKDDYTLTADETKIFTKNAILDLGEKTLTVPGTLRTSSASFEVAAGATVTIQNGAVDLGTTGSSYGIAVLGTLNVNCTVTKAGSSGPAFDSYDGTINFGAAADVTSDSDVVRVKSLRGDEAEETKVTTTVTVAEGAKLKATGTGKPLFYCYKSCTTLEATLNGGEFTAERGVFGDDNKSGDKKDETWNVTIDAAKAKFASDKVEYGTAVGKIIPNQKPILNTGDNWYYLQDAAKVAITATGATVAGVADGDKFVADEAISFTVTPDAEKTIKTVTVNGNPATAGDANAYTYTVTAADITAGTLALVATAEATTPARPPVIEGGDEDQRKAYDAWVAKHPGVTIDPADPLTVDRFALDLAPDATQTEIQQTVDEQVPNIDMAALVAGELGDAVAEIAKKYPNASVILAPTTIEGADTENAKFYQLKISFVPANIGQ